MHNQIRHLADINYLVAQHGEEAYETMLDYGTAYDLGNCTYVCTLWKMVLGLDLI